MPGAGTDKTKRWVNEPAPVVILVEPQLGENVGTTPANLGAAAGTWVSFDVGPLIQDQIDNNKPIIFYMTFISTTYGAYASFNDNGREDAAQDERFYLEVWKQ